MYHQEHLIAQAKHAAFLALFYRPAPEGMRVRVPNLFDRVYAYLRATLTGRPHAQHKGMHAQKAAAR
jgi:hypothetical protein